MTGELDELRRKRLNYIESARENNFEDGIKRLLTDLYPDNAHFIYELLQNAEDPQATTARFTLGDSAVEFEHDGVHVYHGILNLAQRIRRCATRAWRRRDL